MNKRHLMIIYFLLVIIIITLIYLIVQNHNLKNEIINIGNYISEKVDILTSYVK